MPTDFNQIQFNKDYHSYTLNGKRLKGVTSVVYKLKPPFDEDGSLALKKATEAGCTVEEIRAKWDAKKKASMERGSKVHADIAKFLTSPDESSDPYLVLNHSFDLPEVRVFKNLWATMLDNGNVAHQVEWVVGDEELGLAGTCDVVLYNSALGQYQIIDWKTGSEFRTSNRFGTLSEPFNDLDDCELSIYSLQLSAYSLIVSRNIPDLNLGRGYIVHLTPDGYTFYKALDLRDRVEKWLLDLRIQP